MPQFVTTKDGKRHEFPDGATPDQMRTALASYVKAPPAASSPPVAAQQRVVGNPLMDAAKAKLPGILPSLGAAPGGLIPGPLGWALSAAGGMAGKGAQMAMTGEQPGPSMSFPDALAARGPGFLGAMLPPQVMAEGAKQGALSVAGGAVAGPVKRLGVAAYRGALRPTAGLLRKFPNVVDDMMRQRIPLGAAGEAKAGKLAGEAAARTGAALDEAELAGKMVPTAKAEKLARQLIDKVKGSGLKVNQRVKMLEKEMDDFVRDNAASLTPNQANELVNALQEEIEAVFTAKQAGTLIKGGDRLVMKLRARLERGMREAMREQVPKVVATKQASQKALAAQAGVGNAKVNIGKGVPARIPLVPTAVRAFLPDELRSIGLWSRLGLGMADPATQAGVRQVPRGIESLFGAGSMPPDTLDNRR